MGSISRFHRVDKIGIKSHLIHNSVYDSEGVGVNHHSSRVFDYFILFLNRIGFYFGMGHKPLLVDSVNEEFGGLKIGLKAEKTPKGLFCLPLPLRRGIPHSRLSPTPPKGKFGSMQLLPLQK